MRAPGAMIDFSRNHFELFGLPERFVVDADALERSYRALQSEVHPDRFAAAAETQRRLALQSSARVNEAYRALQRSRGPRAVSAVAARRRCAGRDRHRAARSIFWNGSSSAARPRATRSRHATRRRWNDCSRTCAPSPPRSSAPRRAARRRIGVGHRARPGARAEVPRQARRRHRRHAGRTGILMALLQISEPGESPAPHERRLAVGHRSRHDQFAGRDGAQRHSGRAAGRKRPSAAAVDRPLRRRRRRRRHGRAGDAGERPAEHDRVGEAADGPRPRRPRRRRAAFPITSSTSRAW